jgi:hypothetical protein
MSMITGITASSHHICAGTQVSMRSPQNDFVQTARDFFNQETVTHTYFAACVTHMIRALSWVGGGTKRRCACAPRWLVRAQRPIRSPARNRTFALNTDFRSWNGFNERNPQL